ncbi:MAG: cysteine--tRNA ligase [bacterium]
MMFKLYNSLSRKIESFEPLDPPKVGMYACGITAYDYTHIGHGRKYIGDDFLRRTLEFLGYKVNHVQNVTDVGHLVSDADEGEDKLEKGAKKYGKTPEEVAKFFADYFYNFTDRLNILRPHTICWASKHIKEQIALVEILIQKGFAYDTPEAVYFDISKFSGYDQLFNRGALGEKRVGVRGEVEVGEHKKNPQDFALWFKRVGRFENHTMHWDSPWGDGFPGWHIECSAMSMKYLGVSFDIHTGGEDHLFPHHPNEIAQSEGATGKPLAKYWVHHIFLKVAGRKMGKSLGNLYTLDDLEKKGFDPLDFRYLCLQTHYRKPLNFTWQSLEAAKNSLSRLKGFMLSAPPVSSALLPLKESRAKFETAIANDLNLPEALAVVWDLVGAANRGEVGRNRAVETVLAFDKVLGLGLSSGKNDLSQEVLALASQREKARREKDYKASDGLRSQIEKLGYKVKDTAKGQEILPV